MTSTATTKLPPRSSNKSAGAAKRGKQEATPRDRATPATLALLAGPDGVGCLHPAAWARYGAWMQSRGLLSARVAAASILDTSFLPKRCSA